MIAYLPENYPEEIPTIDLVNESPVTLNKDTMKKLIEKMTQICEEKLDKGKMIESVY